MGPPLNRAQALIVAAAEAQARATSKALSGRRSVKRLLAMMRGALARIEAALAQSPELVGGNFRLIFDGGSAFSDWLTGFYAWFRGHGLYYGDSGIFVRRPVYDAIGGMRPYTIER